MFDIKKVDSGYIIGDKIFFGETFFDKDYINLIKVRGEDIIMGCNIEKKIDYPGEYDIDGIYFKVFDINGSLNFILNGYNGKNIAIIQNSEILEIEELEDIDFWFFENDIILQFLEKMEYEGEKIKLE